MAKRVNSSSTNISASLLPNIYRTDANKKFLHSTIEQLTQRGTISKINGFIGRENSKATIGTDVFVQAADTTRQNYQLEPSIVINDQQENNIFFKDYQDYINQLQVFGSDVSNHSRLNKSDIYSWDPQIDWDKFVNFQQYYWMPSGPQLITIPDSKENIIGNTSYSITDSITMSNGMLIKLNDNKQYYVEGVGKSIVLVDYSLFSSNTSDVHDYIVINRASNDRNKWTLSNKWVHIDVIKNSFILNSIPFNVNSASRAKRPIIEFKPNLWLFNYGYNRIVDVEFYDDITTDAFSLIEGSKGYIVNKKSLAAGDKIIFSADLDSRVKNNVYEVTFVKSKIHLKLVHTSSEFDVVTIINKKNSSTSVEMWFDGLSWKVAQQKTSVNQQPLFDVVGESLHNLTDTNYYLGSTFAGTKIFSYATRSNGIVDPVLGLVLSYKSINNIGDILFNFDFATDVFKFTESSVIKTTPVSTGFLKIIENNKINYVNCWEACTLTNTQAAVRIYKNSGIVNNFKLDIYDDINNLNDLEVRVYINGVRLNQNSGTTINWTLDSDSIYNIISLTNDILDTDILTIRSFSKQPINSNGYYELPLNLQNNPQNKTIESISLSEMLDHVDSIVDNLGTQFIGDIPGSNNLRDLPYISSYGTKFIKHGCPFELSLFHITSETTNVIKSLEKSRDEYNKFKRTFLMVAETLGVDTDAKTHVDLILTHINKNIPLSDPYYYSDMIPYGASSVSEFEILDYRFTKYPLINVFNPYILSNKAVGVYLNGLQLVFERDYTIDLQGFVDIIIKMNTTDTLTIYEYDNTNGCFVPETPTKLGIWPKFEPRKYLDTTLNTPVEMIQGHDGSLVLSYGDYRDDLILELEKRIYNNIKINYDTKIFDIDNVIPRYGVENDYSLTEFNNILGPSFYKWTSLVDTDFTKMYGYDSTNPFTFNYYGYYTSDNNGVPGYWRGIYKWIFGTDRPNICPWEMLGFSIKPLWWDTTYGVAPYTSDNLVMWDDIANGLIKEPGNEVVILKYARPYIVGHLPVDHEGNLVNPLATGLISGTITSDTKNNFVFGDVSPVESAWRRSSHFPFSVLIASILLTPVKSIGVLLDRSRISKNVVGQLIYKETNSVISANDILVPAVYNSNTTTKTSGIINYVVNYIVSSDLSTYNQYVYNLLNLKFVLSYRVGGFTSKEKFKLLLDSTSPLTTGNVFVPQEDYSVILNTSSTTKKISYSGIIINNTYSGYTVKGYSITQPYFTYYPWISSGPVVNVGGISESFVLWESNQFYNAGQIIKVGNSYYRTISSFRSSSTFDVTNLQLLSKLPIVGGRDVIFRKSWDKDNPITIPYNTTFDTIQDVVDFILGYGEWLKDQGFVFDDFNTELNQVANWKTSAKEFMFWTTQNWSKGKDIWTHWKENTYYPVNSIVEYNGNYYSAIQNVPASTTFEYSYYEEMYGLSEIGSSVISLSPSANKITFSTNINVVDDITNKFNDYEIFRVDGQPIKPNELKSSRDGNLVSYSPKNDDGIYSATFYLVQKEHVVVLNNNTLFKDLIYDPISGYKQNRIKISAHISTDWYGGLHLPGFIYDEATIKKWSPWESYALGDVVQYQSLYYSANSFISGSDTFNTSEWNTLPKKPTTNILPNWTNIATQFTEFYGMEIESFNNSQQNLAQHLIGYQKRKYLDNIIQDDISEFKFYQGMILDKGTQNVLGKLFDSSGSSLTFHEEWAIREGQYGASSAFNEIEFVLNEPTVINNPQWYLLNSKKDPSISDYVNQLTPNDVYLKPFGYNSNPWINVSNYKPVLRSAGYPRESDVLIVVKDLSELITKDISIFEDGSYVWCTFENKSWNVYRYTDTGITITDAVYATNNVTLTADKSITTIAVGDYIGISGVTKFSKFYKVESISGSTFVISAPALNLQPPFTEQSSIKIYKFVSHRLSSIDDAQNMLPLNIKQNELLWSDNDGTGKWSTWEHNSVYSGKMIPNPYKSINANYGRSIAYSKNNSVIAVSTTNGEIYVYNSNRKLSQVISRPFISKDDLNKNNTFASVIAISDDGKWLAIGSPMVSHAATMHTQSNFNFDSSNTSFDASITNFDNNNTSNTITVDMHKVMNAYDNSTYIQQGTVSVYERDTHGLYYIKQTYTSPSPANNEFFGSSLEFSNNTLYVGANGSSNKAGKVYMMEYKATIHVSTEFNVIGSDNNIIKVASTNGIKFGMYLKGTGFNSNQYVASVGLDGYTLILNDAPDTQPAGIIEFVTYAWDHSSTSFSHVGSTNFGSSIIASEDNSSVVIASNGNVYVYKNNVLKQTISKTSLFFGRGIAVSENSEYIAISDMMENDSYTFEGSVYVYKLQGETYVQYQKIVNRLPVENEHFGTRLSFMNDYKTLIVYSGDIVNPYGRIEIYDRYSDFWIYAERLSPLIISAKKIVSGNTYTISSRGTTNFISIGASTNTIGTRFVATGPGDGTGTVSIDLANIHTVDAGSFIIGNTYTISLLGTTDFTLIGASTNTVGTSFIASGIGTGTGKASLNLGFAVSSNMIAIGEPSDNDNKSTTTFNSSGLVFEYKKQINSYSWIKKYTEIEKPDVFKIKKVFLYNKRTNDFIKYLDVLDPIQGKIAGPAAQEITYREFTDPAVYSVAGSTYLNIVDNDVESAWTSKQVGELWWDLSTAKFVEYYDSEIIYRTNTWNKLAYGASIDVYEWVESSVLPSVWDSQADTAGGLASGMSGISLYGDNVYSIKQSYDNISKTTKNTYYFWVKNKTTIPSKLGRSLSADSVSTMISSPNTSGYQHIAITSSNSFYISNLSTLTKKDDVVLSIQYWLIDNNHYNIHSQWKLISNDSASIIPNNILEKWIDSLCGSDIQGRLVPDISLPPKLLYGIENRPRQSMFVNRFEALKQCIEHANIVLAKNQVSTTRDLSKLESYDTVNNVSKNLYDIVVDTDLDLSFVNPSIFKKPSLIPVILDGRIVDIQIINSGVGYQNSPMVEVVGTGKGAIVSTNINSKGQIISFNIISGGNGYNDDTVLNVRNYAVLVKSDSESNGSWCLYSYDSELDSLTRKLVKSYDTTKYWYYKDWYKEGYDEFTVINYVVNIISDIQQVGIKTDDVVKVKTGNGGNWVLLKIGDNSGLTTSIKYTVIGIQNGTIQLSDSLYKSAQYDSSFYALTGYDDYPNTELRIILESLKNDIFINDLYTEYLNLFFSSIRYALSEQGYLDWIFKTSFIKAKHNASPLHQPVTYRNDNLGYFQEYVSEVKPYRTQIREYLSSYSGLDNSKILCTDFDLPAVYSNGISTSIQTTVKNGGIISSNSIINDYPWKSWLDNVGFEVVDIIISEMGDHYDTAPEITITSSSGQGAAAVATLVDGRVTKITVTSPGSGYLSTPTVIIGASQNGSSAVAIAVLGNSVARATNLKMKFDRISYDYTLNSLTETEVFIGDDTTSTFLLKWYPDTRVGYTTVKINGVVAFSHEYVIKSIVQPVEYNFYSTRTGSITFITAPANNSIIEVFYTKNVEILNATDRIQFFSNKSVDGVGNQLSQVMNGVEYGGVIIDGISFDINSGWNNGAYNASRWSTYDPTFTDYTKIITKDDKTKYEILLPYIPVIGELLTVYKNNERLDDLYYDTPDQININAVMKTIKVLDVSSDTLLLNDDGTRTIILPSSLIINLNDTLIVRKLSSDGSITPDLDDIDTLYKGGDLAYTTALGYTPSDMNVDGDGFVTPTTSPAPEELVSGHIMDTLSIKIFDYQNDIGYQQFKDILNKNHYLIIDKTQQTELIKPLLETDSYIYVKDATVLDEPHPEVNKPGVIEIGTERIEYFYMKDNILGKLRRSTLGTGGRAEYLTGSVVQNIGYSKHIEYSDKTIIKTFVVSSDINLIDLDFIPSKSSISWNHPSNFVSSIPHGFGQADEIEIFVGGYTHTIWDTNTIYHVDQVIIYNGVLYRVNAKHRSSTVFNSDVTLLNDSNNEIGTIDYNNVYSIFDISGNNQWMVNTVYDVNQVIYYNSQLYRVTVKHRSGQSFDSDVITLTLDNTEISTSVNPSSVREICGNHSRLKKSPYIIHNKNESLYSPTGDVYFDADYSVDGVSKNIRLTNKLPVGTIITIVKQMSIKWNNQNTI